MRIVFFLCLLSVNFVPVSGQKGWRGLVPLHSTRNDVRKLLGSPGDPGQLRDRYYFDKEMVEFMYSDGYCEKDGPGGWNVAEGTIIRIIIKPEKKLKLSDLKIDLSKFEKREDTHLEGIFYYVNDEDGIVITETNGRVKAIRYVPMAKDEYLACPDK
jgi:hypothetical protein